MGFLFSQTRAYYKEQKLKKKMRTDEDKDRHSIIQLQQEIKKVLKTSLVAPPDVSFIHIYVKEPTLFQSMLNSDIELQNAYKWKQIFEINGVATEGRVYEFTERYFEMDLG